MARLLVVEDDDDLGDPLVRALAREGHEVDRVRSGADAVRRLAAAPPQLLLLDLGLPDLDGLDVCRIAKRQQPPVPTLMLTARSGEIDEVHGLDAGADDYLTKPFSLAVLNARIRALLRRVEGDALRAGDIRLEPGAHRAWRGDRELDLTPTEFELLELLLRNAGLAVRREVIMERIWGPGWWGSTKTLDVHAGALRRKLGAPEVVTTLRSVGYRLDA